jgi:hypothetical protein
MSYVGGGWRSGSAADVATGANSTATVSGVAPTTYARKNQITLTVTGTGFTNLTVIHANYAPVATTFDSATQLRCVGFNTTPDNGAAGPSLIGVRKPGEKMSGTQTFNAT